MKSYTIERVQDYEAVIGPLQFLHRAHWDETEDYRHSNFQPQYRLLRQYWDWGLLRIWVARCEGKVIGHLTAYVSTSVHTGEQIATEDALYVLPEHRKGVGTELVRRALADLKEEGVAEVWATAKPQTRVGLLLKRLRFAHVADSFHIRLKGSPHVLPKPTSSA